MKYKEYVFSFTPSSEDASDVLSAMLGECGFESFVKDDNQLKAYIQRNVDCPAEVDAIVASVAEMMNVEISSESVDARDENWNEAWEREGFQPIVIGNIVAVHSTHHNDVPQCNYDIVINPCMAFGTGSHVTTRMLLTWLLQHDLKGRDVIDAGCGTGILGILAMMRGARHLLAYDIDEWSVENARSNFAMNDVEGELRHGDSSVIEGETADLLIANINRNILLADMPRFAAALNDGGILLLSGFYTSDAAMLADKAALCGLDVLNTGKSDSDSSDCNWCWLELQKNN